MYTIFYLFFQKIELSFSLFLIIEIFSNLKPSGTKTLYLLQNYSQEDTHTHTHIFSKQNQCHNSFEAHIHMHTYTRLIREANWLSRCDCLKRRALRIKANENRSIKASSDTLVGPSGAPSFLTLTFLLNIPPIFSGSSEAVPLPTVRMAHPHLLSELSRPAGLPEMCWWFHFPLQPTLVMALFWWRKQREREERWCLDLVCSLIGIS